MWCVFVCVCVCVCVCVLFACACVLFALFCYFNVDSLEEGDVVTECSIKTHEAVETLDFEFYGSNVVNKIIMKVNTLLCTCLVEFDHVSVSNSYFSGCKHVYL